MYFLSLIWKYQSFSNFLQKTFEKNLIFELRSKNLWTYQNIEFFKLQYLKNELRYEVEFLHVTIHP